MSDGYRNATKPDKPKWVGVVCPDPVFSSADEKFRLEAAIQRHPRQAGEDVVAWLERVNAAAGVTALPGRLPYCEPGEDDA